jgi:hypothetical protein
VSAMSAMAVLATSRFTFPPGYPWQLSYVRLPRSGVAAVDAASSIRPCAVHCQALSSALVADNRGFGSCSLAVVPAWATRDRLFRAEHRTRRQETRPTLGPYNDRPFDVPTPRGLLQGVVCHARFLGMSHSHVPVLVSYDLPECIPTSHFKNVTQRHCEVAAGSRSPTSALEATSGLPWNI